MRDARIISLLIGLAAITCYPAFADSDRTAKLTEKHGDVYKRGFIDWNREQWGEPSPANLGDQLSEGTQVGTGSRSWAQLTWKNVSARAWENSIYAIAPNQRLVYLMGGEMLFQLDKKRKDKAAYYVWTKLLQARMRGTTALVQADNDVARVTVLEGTIDVLNRVDHSLVRLQPGVVYEIRSRDAALPGGITSTITSAGANTKAPVARSINSITLPGQAPVPLFDSAKTLTSVLPLNPVAALSHPLLQGFTAPLASIQLISTAMSLLPPGLSTIGQTLDKVTGVTGPLVSTLQGVTQPLTGGVTSALETAIAPLTSSAGGIVDQAAGTLTSYLNVASLDLVQAALSDASGVLGPAGLSGITAPVSPATAAKEVLLTGGVGKTSSPGLPPALAVIVQNTEILSVPKKQAYKAGPLTGSYLPWPAGAAEFPPTGRFTISDAGQIVDLPGAPIGQAPAVSGLGLTPGVTPTGINTGAIPGIGAQTGGFTAAAGTLTSTATSAVTGVSGAVGGVANGALSTGGGLVNGITGAVGNLAGGANSGGGLLGGLGGAVNGLIGGSGGNGGNGGGGGALPGGGGGGLLPGGLGGILPGGGGGLFGH